MTRCITTPATMKISDTPMAIQAPSFCNQTGWRWQGPVRAVTVWVNGQLAQLGCGRARCQRPARQRDAVLHVGRHIGGVQRHTGVERHDVAWRP